MFAEVCSTTKRCHVFAGIKIIDSNVKHPGTKESMFKYELTVDSENGSGVHANELMTYISFHFVVGKESNEVFSTDFRKLFDFATR